MARHLTPTELARETGLERRDLIVKCVELGVPIFQGRIDRDLFLTALGREADMAAIADQADHFTLLDSDGNLVNSFGDLAAARAALREILASEPDAHGRVALLAYDASGHPVADLTGTNEVLRSSVRPGTATG